MEKKIDKLLGMNREFIELTVQKIIKEVFFEHDDYRKGGSYGFQRGEPYTTLIRGRPTLAVGRSQKTGHPVLTLESMRSDDDMGYRVQLIDNKLVVVDASKGYAEVPERRGA